jgi:hypothetical protein
MRNADVTTTAHHQTKSISLSLSNFCTSGLKKKLTQDNHFEILHKKFRLNLINVIAYSIILCVPTFAQSLSLSSTPIISEGDDYATRIIGKPWDMTTPPYPDLPTVLYNINRASFTSSNGYWNFTTATNDPSVNLVETGIANTQKVLKLGDTFPVNTSKYHLLSFRMYSNIASTANVYWFYDQSPHTNPSNGVSHFININPGWNTYVIDLAKIGTFQGAWTGNIKGLRLDPVSTGTGVNLQFDWIRLTSVNTANVMPISWSGANNNSMIYFYVNSTCNLSGATLIGVRQGSSGVFNWGATLEPNSTTPIPLPLPESFQPGQYSIFALINNSGLPICATSTLEIHKAPILEFQKPSFYSGPDYASEQINDAWGMGNVQDISQVFNLVNYNFTNGILNGTTNSSGDPALHLNTPTPINSNRYKYLTFRMLLDGNQDIGAGWVSRWLWWYLGATIDPVTSSDMLVYEGWHTYSVNLSNILIDQSSNGSWTGMPTQLRLDPDELPAPATFT